MTDGVRNFLHELGLSRYYDMFVAKGFDSEGDVAYLNEEDLDAMYISEEADRRKILESASGFQPSKEYLLYEWLRERGLDHYFISFVQSELVDLTEIGHLSLPDEQLYDELEIMLPGHRRRLERAVRHLSKRQRTMLPAVAGSNTKRSQENGSDDAAPTQDTSLHMPMEVPVAYGRWAKPRCLQDAKYDFLVLDATLVSTKDRRDKVRMEFMVDSGSDVVTIREEVLDTMDLELIGPINSKGVHASRRKNLYRANMVIGNQSLEIEVMGESYDSIGSRVIRHFRHYISGDRHVWLKGDFVDPTMSVKSIQPLSSEDSFTTTSDSDRTMSSLNASSEPLVPCSQESIPGLSEQSSASQPEEASEKSSKPESMETADVLIVENVQKDFVQKSIETEYALEAGVEIDSEKIKFEFSKLEEMRQNDDEKETTKQDETDKLLCNNNEIIDIRPIIAANRKRRADDITGFEPRSGVRKTEELFKAGAGPDLFHPVKEGTMNNHDHTLETAVNSQKVEHTVLGVRSVYYRSRGSGPSDMSS